MRRPSVRDAHDAVEARKASAFAEAIDNGANGVVLDVDGVAPLFIGFDVNSDELAVLAATVANVMLLGVVARGVPPEQALAGSFVQGFATGLMLVDLQRAHDAREARDGKA